MSKSIDKRDEALKLALEALEDAKALLNGKNGTTTVWFAKEITAIREALNATLAEQPRGEATLAQQQEPVAWRVRWPKMGGGYTWIMNDAPLMAEHGFVNEALYTSPQPSKPWVGLTDAQIGAMAADIWGSILIAPQSHQAFARAIEAKLREKNT